MNHREQVIGLLRTQIESETEVRDIEKTADEVASQWISPTGAGKEQVNGLIYGFVQSGKTGVLSVTGAVGADQGYNTIIILTSDIEPLYNQTLARVQEAFPGIDIIGKKDFKDPNEFVLRLKSGPCAVVTTKNAQILKALIENLKLGRARGLSCLIIDDEADQASLNTKASKDDGTRSAINDRLAELRGFFSRNTYLQVTATPQALFLQPSGHELRPAFTVLSHPGGEYVGGDDFFGDGSTLVREFDINDITTIAPGPQPIPQLGMPPSLYRALDTFMVGATYKRLSAPDQNCAFLCHVSTRKDDHQHIVDLLRKYKTDLAGGIKNGSVTVRARLRAAYDDLSATHPELGKTEFARIVEAIGFFSPGINVKLVNGETDEDVAVRSPYNLFVGGNKLGRGVTIKNLLVSYYGRHPKRPQADTVLQHARMYGYRRRDFGLLRLFLPRELHTVFRAINRMEKGLRELIARQPDEEFRGIYVEGNLAATRKNVLIPGAVGIYTGGGIYNPAQVRRDNGVVSNTAAIDKKLASIGNKVFAELSIAELKSLIALTLPDERESELVWDPVAVAESVAQFAKLNKQTKGRVYVDRERGLREKRRETQGILDGGESGKVPKDLITLFMLRIDPEKGEHATWWPQIRFPDGRYAFAFAV
jgi:hypothetical protein